MKPTSPPGGYGSGERAHRSCFSPASSAAVSLTDVMSPNLRGITGEFFQRPKFEKKNIDSINIWSFSVNFVVNGDEGTAKERPKVRTCVTSG